MSSGVEVELGGQVRRLRYPLRAIEKIEERFGADLVKGDELEFSGLGDVAWIVCLGLEHAGETWDGDLRWWERLLVHFGIRPAPRITEELVAEWVDLRNIDAVTKALHEAMGGRDATGTPEGNPTLRPSVVESRALASR